MNPAEKLAFELAESLLERTNADRLHWFLAEGDAFQFDGSEASVAIRSRDRDGTAPFVFELLDATGRLAQALETGWASSDGYNDDLPHEWNDVLRGLYYAARISAYDIGHLASSLLADVDAGKGLESAPGVATGGGTPSDDLDDLPF